MKKNFPLFLFFFFFFFFYFNAKFTAISNVKAFLWGWTRINLGVLDPWPLGYCCNKIKRGFFFPFFFLFFFLVDWRIIYLPLILGAASHLLNKFFYLFLRVYLRVPVWGMVQWSAVHFSCFSKSILLFLFMLLECVFFGKKRPMTADFCRW